MASEQPSDKSAATGAQTIPGSAVIPATQPQIPSPLSSDGLELMRDTHC